MKPETIFGRSKGITFYRHHVEPRVKKLCVSEEESFPIPLRNIDEVRKTITTLGELLESRINDYWNADGDRNLTQFTIFNEKPPDGYM